jgi:hypothetical protein
MFSENCALYEIASLAARFVEMVDNDGSWPARPKPRDFDRLALRLQRLLDDATEVLNPQYSPPATRAERREHRARETFAKALDTLASALATTVQPKPAPLAAPGPVLKPMPRPVFTHPEWLISLR